jgi:phosphoglycolate phosphatase
VKRLARMVFGRKKEATPLPPSKPKVLIFDFDGTIGDTFAAGVEILNQLAKEFGFRSLPPEEVQFARQLKTLQLMKHLGIPVSKMSRIAHRGSEEIGKRIHHVIPLPGMPELLHELKKRGVTLGIITSNTEANVKIFLKNHDLDFFDFIRSSSKLLGKARIIRSELRARKIAKPDVLFVGDETRDIEACQKAGVRIAAVTWGFNSTDSLKALNPDYLFDKPGELLDLLDSPEF